MSARLVYTVVGLVLGAGFPACALLAARVAGGDAGTGGVLAFITRMHSVQPMWYALDCAPLLLGPLAFIVGLRQDLTSSMTVSLRDAAAQRGERVQRLSSDIAAREKLEAQLSHRLFHDTLTNLANRALLGDRIGHALARAGHDRSGVAVLLVDLDDFKTINDTLGHEAGDALLVAVTARFTRVTRPGDTLARLGGDEFALLLEQCTNVQQATTTAQKLIDALIVPIKIGSRYVRIGASIGITLGHPAATAQTLLRDADLAMYDAKMRGKDCLRVFRPEMHKTLVERVELGGDMHRALREGEFHLLYQPIIDLTQSRIVGMEALIRWHHPRRGLISPVDFIKIAEETSSIVPLGTWILNAACRQMALWQNVGTPSQPLTLTVNVSPLQLQHPHFIDDVAEALTAAGLQPQQLVLEITESALIDDSAENLAVFNALKELGVRLAIDDFGTGYSSLSYLQRFPFDILKIDKAFVDGVAGSGSDAAFARTIIALGEMLELRVLAEGIEHGAQLAKLKELGCEFGQGFLFAKPLDVGSMTALLEGSAFAGPAAAVA